MKKYAFYRASLPSFAEVGGTSSGAEIGCAVNALFAHLIQQPRFAALEPEQIPYIYDVVEGASARIAEANGGAVPGHLTETVAICRQALDQLGLRHRDRWPPLSPEMAALSTKLAGTYHGRDLHRLMLLASTRGRTIAQIDDEFCSELGLMLQLDPSVKHPETVLRANKYAFNKIPKILKISVKPLLIERDRPEAVNLPWSAYRLGLRPEIEAALRPKPGFVDWDPNVVAAYAVDDDSLAHGLELIRICLGALVRSGIPAAEITLLRDFISPERFSRIAWQLFKDAGNDATRLVRTKLARLQTVALRSGLLTDDETQKIVKITARNRKDCDAYCAKNPSRVEEAADEVNDAETIAALRRLPIDVFVDPPPARVKRALAAEMKQPTMLIFRLAGLSTVIIRLLDFDAHFTEMGGEHRGCLKLFVPASETANGVACNAVISVEYSRILRQFVKYYRSALDISGSSRFLFPSVGPKPLTVISISRDQVKFLKERFDGRVKPSVIRKIIQDLILSEDPNATGLLAATLGLRDQAYVGKLAKPYQNDQESRENGRLVTSGALKDHPDKATPNDGGDE